MGKICCAMLSKLVNVTVAKNFKRMQLLLRNTHRFLLYGP